MSGWLVVAAFGAGVVVGALMGGVLVVLVRPVNNRRAQMRAVERAIESATQELDTATARSAARLVDTASTQLAHQLDAGSREIGHAGVAIGRQLDAMGTELVRVSELVAGLATDRAVQHGEVVAQLDAAARHGAELARTTRLLRDALNNPRARGQWGERLAEDVLRAAGFVEGTNYRRQQATSTGTVPDFTFLLPEDLVLHMDVKFPIDNYLRYLEADEHERPGCVAAFGRDVRSRLKELNGKGYIEPGVTLDFVIAFIPNESVFSFAHEHDADLVDVALGLRVVLCSPATLFAVLSMVRRVVDNFSFREASDEILECLVSFGSEWEKYGEAVDGLGRRLELAQTAYDSLAGPRRRQLQRRLDRVAELRAGRVS